MFITRKHIDRRLFLRGAGVAIALPLLDAMVPASTALARTAAAAKQRLGFVYFPHGAIMEKWTPATVGRDFEFSPILEPLAPLRKYVTVVSGLGNKPGESRAVHALVPGTWLTCTHPTEGVGSRGGVSVDQLAAAAIGQETPYPSLEIATAQGHGVGSACERGYGCAYSGTVSFRTPTTPLPVESNPRELFLRLFGQGESAEDRRFLMEQNRSLLDMVAGEAASLKRRIGPQDQALLSDYLDSIREIERRVQRADRGDIAKLDLPETPGATPEHFDELLNLLFDLKALAYQGDLTRVSSFMMGPEVSEQTFNHIGVSDAFHALSHHANEQPKKDRLAQIQRYHTQAFARFLQKLEAIPDGEGNLLDHSTFVYGSNMSNSNLHNQYPLPTVLVGGGCGRIRGNQHIRYEQRTPLANVLLTVAQRAGVNVERFGDSTGAIAEL